MQTLISGAAQPIDFRDLRAHTHYAGYDESEPYIEAFWDILASFEEADKCRCGLAGSVMYAAPR
jgi:hypothetical protein